MYLKYILIIFNTFPTYIKYIRIIFKYTTIIFIKQCAHRIYKESCTGGHTRQVLLQVQIVQGRGRENACKKRKNS